MARRQQAILSRSKQGIKKTLLAILDEALERRLSRGLCLKLIRLVGQRFPRNRLSMTLVYHVGDRLPLEPSEVHKARLVGGAHLNLRLDEYMWRSIYLLGVHEPETTAFFRRWLRAGDVVIDVGANVGYFTCIAAKLVGRRGAVHAFEPNPEVSALLRASISTNGFDGWVTCNANAVGRSSGSAPLYIHPDPALTGWASLLKYSWGSDERAVPVPVVTLDQYCAQKAIVRVRLLKIDIEGGEAELLRGASNLLRQVRPDAIVCEVQGNELDAQYPHALFGIFRQYHYQPFTISKDGKLRLYRPGEIQVVNLCFRPCPVDTVQAQATSAVTASR